MSDKGESEMSNVEGIYISIVLVVGLFAACGMVLSEQRATYTVALAIILVGMPMIAKATSGVE